MKVLNQSTDGGLTGLRPVKKLRSPVKKIASTMKDKSVFTFHIFVVIGLQTERKGTMILLVLALLIGIIDINFAISESTAQFKVWSSSVLKGTI